MTHRTEIDIKVFDSTGKQIPSKISSFDRHKCDNAITIAVCLDGVQNQLTQSEMHLMMDLMRREIYRGVDIQKARSFIDLHDKLQNMVERKC